MRWLGAFADVLSLVWCEVFGLEVGRRGVEQLPNEVEVGHNGISRWFRHRDEATGVPVHSNEESVMPLIVTSEQLEQGYWEMHREKDGNFIRKRPFQVMGRTHDGNYVVSNPGLPGNSPVGIDPRNMDAHVKSALARVETLRAEAVEAAKDALRKHGYVPVGMPKSPFQGLIEEAAKAGLIEEIGSVEMAMAKVTAQDIGRWKDQIGPRVPVEYVPELPNDDINPIFVIGE